MMRPRQVYISRETYDMLKAYQAITKRDTPDEIADDMLRDRLENLPDVEKLVQLRKETEKDFERKAQEIIQAQQP
jgi:class 3 adenylate cyclase